VPRTIRRVDRKDGQFILLVEQLHTPANSTSYADIRLFICLGPRGHSFYKSQYADEHSQVV
jgi:hypothetical protein